VLYQKSRVEGKIMTPRRIKLTIDSNLEEVFLIGLAVNKICSDIPLSELESYQIEMCIVEAVNNAIKHAYGNKSGHDVEIIVEIYIDRITFKVCDYGKIMEQGKTFELDYNPNERENLPEGGMGLHIINEIMDKVTYETSGEKNILTMTKLFSSGKKN